MHDDVIYTVTAGHIESNKWRCWAWFLTLEEAQRAVEGCSDFFCGEDDNKFYTILVIEEVPRGSITAQYNEWWYEWSGDEWRPVPKPAPVECIFHFGVG